MILLSLAKNGMASRLWHRTRNGIPAMRRGFCTLILSLRQEQCIGRTQTMTAFYPCLARKENDLYTVATVLITHLLPHPPNYTLSMPPHDTQPLNPQNKLQIQIRNSNAKAVTRSLPQKQRKLADKHTSINASAQMFVMFPY